MNMGQQKQKSYEAELVVLGASAASHLRELRKAEDYRDHTYGESYSERRKAAGEISTKLQSVKNQIKYRERKLREMEGAPVHHDIFGQELAVGQAVAWSSSSRYSGAQLGYVVGVTDKMIQVGSKPDSDYGANVYPKALINVTRLMT